MSDNRIFEVEKKLAVLESQNVAVLANVAAASSKTDLNSRLLGDLEKVVLQVSADIKNISGKVDSIQREQENLEEEAAEGREKTTREVQAYVTTIVDAVENMTNSFALAVEKNSNIFEKKITDDLEPRLKGVERFRWGIVGALALLNIIVLIAGPSILRSITQ